jgi:hypothetical protein
VEAVVPTLTVEVVVPTLTVEVVVPRMYDGTLAPAAAARMPVAPSPPDACMPSAAPPRPTASYLGQ